MAKSALKKTKKKNMQATTVKSKLREKIAKKRATIQQTKNKAKVEDFKQRDDLIEQYMPFATSIANRVAKSMASSVDYDELLCNARIGLLEAAKKFDDSHNVDFRTFAYYRIKGAIYDGLRRSGWIPRSLYTKIKMEEAANDYLRFKAESSRDSDGENNSEQQMIDTVNSLASIYVISLDAQPDLEIEDDKNVDVEKRAEFQQIREHMKIAIDSLPTKERQLVKMYYFQNKTLEEAGDKLGLSKSWTSRLHARALELLFKRIKQSARGEEIYDEGVK